MLSGKSCSSASDQLLELVVVAEPSLRHQVEEARFSLPGAAREKRSKRFSRIAVSPLEIIDLCKPQRHQLGIRIAFCVRFETKKTGTGIRVAAAAEQALPPAHFQLVARVAGRELLHFRQSLQRTFCLGSMLAEWKFVIQVQVGCCCALRIAVSERVIRKAQPDGRDIDRCFVENVFVDFGGVPEITLASWAASASPSAAASPTNPGVFFSSENRRRAASNRPSRNSETPA